MHNNQPEFMPSSAAGTQVWDLRSCQKPTADIPTHKMPTRSISFAPHNEMRMVTSGDDCKLRFWDMRYVFTASKARHLRRSA